MVTKEKKTRGPSGGIHYEDENIHTPIYTVGKCENRGYGKRCTNYGELGDGLCMSCWDRRENSKKAIAREKYRRKHVYKHRSTEVMI